MLSIFFQETNTVAIEQALMDLAGMKEYFMNK